MVRGAASAGETSTQNVRTGNQPSASHLFVDLHAENLDSHVASSDGTSEEDDPDPESEGVSNDDDNPDDGEDQYIRVISRRSKRNTKKIDRGRGPLNL